MNFKKLLISIVSCQIVGLLGSFATYSSIRTWYPTLIKPSFTPPNFIFAPVWTVLYILMGIAAYLIWEERKKDKVRVALWFFVAQLVINFSWSFVFFGLQSTFGGLVVIVLLWSVIVKLINLFYPINKTAAYLLTPYLLWVTFAGALNVAFWILNP